MIYVHHFPVYWCVERDAKDRTFLTRSHMQETAPPYRMSRRAFRIRVSHKHWLHLGTYRYHVDRNYWGIGGVTANQIAKWRSGNTDRVEGVDSYAANGSRAASTSDRDESQSDG